MSGEPPSQVWLTPRFAVCPAAKRLVEGPAAILSAGSSTHGGRGDHRLLPAADWGCALRVRPGRRGGALGRWLGDRYAGPGRAQREHACGHAAFDAGLPVAEPAFAAAWRSGLAWRIAIATVERPDARDALAWLEASPSRVALLDAVRAIAETLRRLHDAGLVHGDLQLRNLLLEAERPGRLRCIAIDLDRARERGGPLDPGERMREWMRLVRSCEKTGWGHVLSARVVAHALAHYCRGDRALRRAMLARRRVELMRIRLHRLSWRR